MKSIKEISDKIKESFQKRTGYSISSNTIIDNFLLSTSDGIQEAYIEIENNKNPHLYTNLKDEEIDELGLLLNIPRRDGEDYETYHYRLLNWTYHYERGNLISIITSILNLKYSSNASYIPMTHGTGTGSIYIIPREYTHENNEKAIEEIKERIHQVIAPDSYVEYKIVKPISVKLIINLLTYSNTDISSVKNSIEVKTKDYINNIAPGETLSLLELEKIGIMERNIKYFSISSMIVNGEPSNEFELIQDVKNKFLLDSIEWILIEEGETNA